jgi:hypothetical protein
MIDSSVPQSAAQSDPAEAQPLASHPSIAASAVVARLRYRPKLNAPVAEVEVKVPLFRFWQAAREWDSRMRNRNRWIADETLRTEVADLARDRLKEWTVDESAVAALGRARVVEVLEGQTVPDGGGLLLKVLSGFWRPLIGQLRRMPWESLLVMAARKFQNHERLLVYRRIHGLESRKYEFEPGKLSALFVETAPGALWSVYDFNFEFRAVETYLKGVTLARERNLTLTELTEYIQSNSPAIIHVSAIDGYQGSSILKNRSGTAGVAAQPVSESSAGSPAEVAAPQTNSPQDGVFFRDELGQPKVETPEAVAAALCSGKNKPLLVTLNLYNSSARLAAEIVTRGAAAAIGFQDFIDDTVCEIFFANLFRAWTDNPGTPLLQAFQDAVQELEPYVERIRGTGVTLWTSEPLLDDPTAIGSPSPKKEESKSEGTGPASDVELEFTIETYPALNYSVLHNGKSKMFETFRVYKFGSIQPAGVRVEINLNVGGHNFSFRESYLMRHHILDLTDKIAVGLTSALSRSLRESVRTTIFVRITIGPDDERFCKTFDVSLLAVDEWIDDLQSGIFLPSFVLPRDPVIPDIIAKAQGYLTAIADDAAQGFDGYQSCQPDDDPDASLEPQTRAIWYALQHDFAVKYINPPPTFTESSQRLRTPSETLKGGRGTCIDLALLLAACFEHIGLYPVIFLLSGHAFVGYWADEERRKEFRKTKYDRWTVGGAETLLSLLPQDLEDIASESVLEPVEWRYDVRRRAEIKTAVQNGELVAIEATYLTNGGSFAAACDVGESNLDADEGFEAMLDISLARDNRVTPLPMAIEEGS